MFYSGPPFWTVGEVARLMGEPAGRCYLGDDYESASMVFRDVVTRDSGLSVLLSR